MKYLLTFLFLLMCLKSFGQDQQKMDSLNVVILEYSRTVDWKQLIEAYFEKGKLYHSDRNYEAAVKQFLRVDSIAKLKNYLDKNTVMALLHRANISRSTYTYDGMETADILGEEALSDAKKLDNETLIYAVYKDLAYIKNLNDDHAEAKKLLDLAFQYYLKKEDHKSISWLYGRYGSHYNDVDSLKKSEAVHKEHVQYFRTHTDSIELAISLSSLGDFYRMKLNQCKKAMPYLQEAKVVYEKIQLTNIRSYLYLIENLAICHADRNEYQLGYEYYKQAYNLRKDIVREANDVTTRQLEAKYQAKEKDQEIALLSSQNALVEQQKINQRDQLLGAIGFTSLAGLFFFFLYRTRQKTNKKLRELDKAKSNFFANISHEFRTPLTLISGPIQQQLKKDNLTVDERTKFEMINRNSSRLLSLVDQLLDLSKIEAGSLKLKVSKSELMPFIGTLTDSFTYAGQLKEINYIVNNNPSTIDTWFDKDILEKIIVNLISNAFKYTPQRGSIVCNAFITENKLNFEIKNSGPGLSKEELSKIFERFYQLNENEQGVGIGLALIKELVALHKGTIAVTSVTDEWTTFKIEIPVKKEDFKESEIRMIVLQSKVSEEISTVNEEVNLIETDPKLNLDENNDDKPILLIVDDNADIRAYVSSLFKENYTILSALNGKEGVELAIRNVPDIVISDIMMPVKNGIELCNTLKQDERTSHIPIILLTAKAGEENVMEGIETGADAYVTKPFSEELLQIRVEKLIESRNKLQKRYSQEVILRPKDIAITSIDEQFLERLQKVLDEKLVESSYSIEDFSKAVGMSRMQLHRKLKALTGLSATEFIRSQRLKLAAQLLKKSEINVSQVGYTVGFNDHAYFSKCFKEMYGCTPTEFSNKTN